MLSPSAPEARSAPFRLANVTCAGAKGAVDLKSASPWDAASSPPELSASASTVFVSTQRDAINPTEALGPRFPSRARERSKCPVLAGRTPWRCLATGSRGIGRAGPRDPRNALPALAEVSCSAWAPGPAPGGGGSGAARVSTRCR